VLSDLDAKLAAVTAGTLVLVPLLVNVTFPIGLGLALPLACSAGWSTYGLFGRTFQIGPDLPGYLAGKDPTEPALRKRLRADLLASVEANSAKTDRKTKAFNGSGNIFLVSGVAAALLFAIQMIAGQKLPGPLKTAGDWWLANAVAVAVVVSVLSIGLVLAAWYPMQASNVLRGVFGRFDRTAPMMMDIDLEGIPSRGALGLLETGGTSVDEPLAPLPPLTVR
jgi:hypothetical protein